MVRKIGIGAIALLTGWLIYNLPSIALYVLFYNSYTITASWGFITWSTLYNMFFGFLGCFFASIIARGWEKELMITLSILIGFYGFLSLLFGGAKVPLWYQLITICLVPPAAYLGGYARIKILEMD